MKYFIIFCFLLNVLSAFYDKIIIKRSNNPYRKTGVIPHGISSLYDFVLYTGLVLMIYFNVLLISSWFNVIFILSYAVMLRWLIRDFIIGVGTTAFIDKLLSNKFLRTSIQLVLCIILTIIQINVKF